MKDIGFSQNITELKRIFLPYRILRKSDMKTFLYGQLDTLKVYVSQVWYC